MKPNPLFSIELLKWYDVHGRKSLPWHEDKDPYKIWVSEIMLQQTQVKTVIPYFKKFIARFPKINDLANGSQDEVLHHWSGLGYYARARNLKKAAEQMRDQFNGEFPNQFESVLGLPGIGRSTAGAILAFSFNQRHPILDGNVKRVLTRYLGIEGYPGRKHIENQLWEIAESYTPHERVDDYTQAIMDLGATCCVRSKPNCEACPMSSDCVARIQQRQSEFPHRKPKSTRLVKAVRMLIIKNETQGILMVKRPQSGIWGGLWSFPEMSDPAADVNDWCIQSLGCSVEIERHLESFVHVFSHFDLRIDPIVCEQLTMSDKISDQEPMIWFDMNHPMSIGLPGAIQKIFDTLATQTNDDED